MGIWPARLRRLIPLARLTFRRGVASASIRRWSPVPTSPRARVPRDRRPAMVRYGGYAYLSLPSGFFSYQNQRFITKNSLESKTELLHNADRLQEGCLMYALISCPAGIVLEAVIVSRTRNRMRVFAAGFPDVIELRRTGPRWSTENGEQVEFEFLGAISSHPEKLVSEPEVVRAAGSLAI